MVSVPITVNLDKERLAVLDRAVAQNGLSSREEFIEKTLRQRLHRELLDELIDQASETEPSQDELEAELKEIKKIRRDIWEKKYAHLFSG